MFLIFLFATGMSHLYAASPAVRVSPCEYHRHPMCLFIIFSPCVESIIIWHHGDHPHDTCAHAKELVDSDVELAPCLLRLPVELFTQVSSLVLKILPAYSP